MISSESERHGLHRLDIPTPFPALASVNIHILRAGSGFYLVDGGMGGDEARQRLLAALDRLVLDLSDCKGVLHTHGHVDHFGLSAFVHERSGAPLFIHANDADLVEDSPSERFEQTYAPRERLLERCGMPDRLRSRIVKNGRMFWDYNTRLASDSLRRMGQGDSFVTDAGLWTVWETPGHSPGSICLVQKDRRWVLSGDTVLERISPNPLIEPKNERGDSGLSLLTYQRSLETLRDVHPAWLFPGHGDAFTGFAAWHDSLLAFSAKRQDKLLRQLSGHDYTVGELAEIHFPNRSVNEQYLIYSEVLGNLEVMESQGRVIRRTDERDRWLFRVAG